MAVTTGTVAMIYLLTGTGLLFLLREPVEHPNKPGSTGFALAVVGISLWPLSLGVNYFLSELTVSIALWNVRLFASSVISIGWFLVAMNVTTGRSSTSRFHILFVAYLAIEQVLAWTNPLHHFVLGPETAVNGTILAPQLGPWFWVQAAINYGLILAGTTLLAAEWARSSGLRRKQSAVLTVAVVPPIVANLVTIFDVVSTVHDLTPFGLIGSGVLLSWALYRAEFLDVVPVAREVAMAEMQDAVVTLDDEDRVVDCNRSARKLFDIPEQYAGMPAAAFFDPIADETLARFADSKTVDTEVTTTLDDGKHHFSVSISPVSGATDATARVIVLRDITPLKRREEALEAREAELDLLRQVFSRVLRHNIRNKLTTVRGNAEQLRERDDEPSDRERIESIFEATDSLLALSENARTIERVIDQRDGPVRYDLRRVVDRVVESIQPTFPDVSFAVDAPDSCPVTAGSGLDAAIEVLVDNAARYNDGDDPSVRVTVDATGDRPTLSVVDNGPGIPDHEVAVLERNEETPLSHGSGVGLWVVKWVAERSGIELTFETDDSGTTVLLTFGEAEAAATPEQIV